MERNGIHLERAGVDAQTRESEKYACDLENKAADISIRRYPF